MNEVTKMCYEVKDADVARARNQLKASLLFLQDSSQRESQQQQQQQPDRLIQLHRFGRVPTSLC
jgi:hypothetical protein